jgi:hypothetical protein
MTHGTRTSSLSLWPLTNSSMESRLPPGTGVGLTPGEDQLAEEGQPRKGTAGGEEFAPEGVMIGGATRRGGPVGEGNARLGGGRVERARAARSRLPRRGRRIRPRWRNRHREPAHRGRAPPLVFWRQPEQQDLGSGRPERHPARGPPHRGRSTRAEEPQRSEDDSSRESHMGEERVAKRRREKRMGKIGSQICWPKRCR